MTGFRHPDSDEFPYADPRVPFIAPGLGYAQRPAEKIALLQSTEGPIYAVWPGTWRSDVFEVDRDTALAALKGFDR